MIVRVDLTRKEYGHVYLEVDSLDEAKHLVKIGSIGDVQLDDFGYQSGDWEADDNYDYQIVDEDELDEDEIESIDR